MLVRISVSESFVPFTLCRSSVVVKKWREGRFLVHSSAAQTLEFPVITRHK